MDRTETFRRCAVFTAGVLVCAVGVAFVTRAGLGTSPISSIPFVLSLITPVSMGVYTLAFNLFFLLCESLLIGRFGAARIDLVDMLNYSQMKPINEERVLSVVEKFDGSDLSTGNSIYVTTKYALARWVRRISASWAARGVRINAVAPGNVATPMTSTMGDRAKAALAALPIPINYGKEDLMVPEDISNVIVFLASPMAHGVSGNIMFVDGGTDALLNSKKVY